MRKKTKVTNNVFSFRVNSTIYTAFLANFGTCKLVFFVLFFICPSLVQVRTDLPYILSTPYPSVAKAKAPGTTSIFHAGVVGCLTLLCDTINSSHNTQACHQKSFCCIIEVRAHWRGLGFALSQSGMNPALDGCLSTDACRGRPSMALPASKILSCHRKQAPRLFW